MTADHSRYMRLALALTRRNLGQTWPNPSVGAVIVKDGKIIGQGYTARGGRPHAETQALEEAGKEARGATLYVTLEPCSHTGKTAPCSEAIIKAGIARCVIACGDPNPQVNGKGIAQLKAADINVIENVCASEAREVNRGFFSVIEKQRPLVAMHLATSFDGKIATRSGQSQWITGETARAYSHLLRGSHDAIVTGIGTALADNPQLTCRLPGMENKSPVRVVLDHALRLPPDSQLARTAKTTPTWVITGDSKADTRPLEAQGVQILPTGSAAIEPANVLALLAKQGITRVLVEAGQKVCTSFLKSGLVDRIYWFRAPMVIGQDGLSAIGDNFAAELSALARWRMAESVSLKPDTLDILECSPASSAA